jgi:hypothetical protein
MTWLRCKVHLPHRSRRPALWLQPHRSRRPALWLQPHRLRLPDLSGQQRLRGQSHQSHRQLHQLQRDQSHRSNRLRHSRQSDLLAQPLHQPHSFQQRQPRQLYLARRPGLLPLPLHHYPRDLAVLRRRVRRLSQPDRVCHWFRQGPVGLPRRPLRERRQFHSFRSFRSSQPGLADPSDLAYQPGPAQGYLAEGAADL